MNRTLYHYASQLRDLHTHYTKQHNQSPHKFILMLAIIRLYEQGVLRSHQIVLNDNIRIAFEHEWALWISHDHHQMNVGLPVYHMKSEPFWRFDYSIEYKQDFENKNKMKTFSSLQKVVNHAEIDEALCALFRQPESREMLRDVLLSCLFRNS